MKNKVGIITIIDKNNYGNRLQNYALYTFLRQVLRIDVYTLKNYELYNCRNMITLKRIIKTVIKKITKKFIKQESNIIRNERSINFDTFEKNIKYYSKTISAYTNLNKFDYLIVGSDQVWNSSFQRLSDIDVLKYAKNNKKISYAASFGVSEINERDKHIVKSEISKFKNISVREDSAKEIIEELTQRNDIEVLIDPTMLLSSDEWDKIAQKPKHFKNEKYILNYFLGELNEKRKKEIERVAKENNCIIINILDKSDPFYESGPAEFLYLEKNAYLICTDSFHACVFGIIYNRPFIVFEREQRGVVNMNSRIETLLCKFQLKDRYYNGERITADNLKHDYTKAFDILNEERQKSKTFLQNALN